ncbi:YceI family protein [Rubrimonas cliftonensis]|uniref:YceI family protein n=1 Tax=Rubrimonas cliftonensis TaxID=89524 RepID=UPI0015876FC2|nr:YceI family protein [Rubrimonas cliftonensis]
MAGGRTKDRHARARAGAGAATPAAFTLAAFIGALAAAGAAAAGPATWRIDPAASVVRFDLTVEGAPREGRFSEVSGSARFDPDDPSSARLTLDIDVSSLDLGDPLESGFAQGADWFDAKNHPVARYRLARLQEREGATFEALGDLTIKGTLKVVRTPVTVTFEGDAARATGSLTFDRREFGVGVGPSTLFVSIGAETSVSFEIIARREE